MAQRNRAPAVAAGTRNGDQLASEIVPTISQPQRISQALLSSGVAVYDGSLCIGHIIEIERSSVALTPDGITIGTFRSRREAFHAISTAASGRAA
jgi:hypothetical protein